MTFHSTTFSPSMNPTPPSDHDNVMPSLWFDHDSLFPSDWDLYVESRLDDMDITPDDDNYDIVRSILDAGFWSDL